MTRTASPYRYARSRGATASGPTFTRWRAPLSSGPGRPIYDPEHGGWGEYVDGVWQWYAGKKDPWVIADQGLVERKALLGQAIVRGLPYDRTALAAEAWSRLGTWGMPATQAEAVARAAAAGWPPIQQAGAGAKWTLVEGAPEVGISEYTQGIWNLGEYQLAPLLIPQAPAKETIAIPGHLQVKSYP